MQIVDAIIIMMLLLGAVVGFKRGFIKQTVMSVGSILVIILAFMLKNPISVFLYEHLPFYDFDGVFAGVSALNILLYEMLAFIIAASILFIILRLLVGLSSIIEKVLNFTILLGIPSKILGAVLGAIEAYIIIFFVLYIVTLPVFHIKIVSESKFKNNILEKTPVLSKVAGDTVKTFNEIYALKDDYGNGKNGDKFNEEAIRIMLKNKVVTKESIQKLIDNGKLNGAKIGPILE